MIAVIITAGWLLQRTRKLPSQSAAILSAFVYWAAAPCLLFIVIAEQDIAQMLGAPLVVAAASGTASALAFVALGAPLLRVRGGNLVLGAMSASVNNIAYMGIPVAIYVLGSAHHVVPVLAFQMGLLTPVFFVMADLAAKKAPTDGNPVWRIIKTTITNPMAIGAVSGIIVAALRIELPSFISETTTFLGQAAPPTILVAFGASLVGQSARLPRRTMAVVSWATLCKLGIQPVVAGLVGWVMGVTGMGLAGIIIMAALPTAQNAFIAAMRAGTGKEIAQGTVLLTTVVSLPLVVALVAVLRVAGLYTGV